MDSDVVVVGGGIGGLATALGLSRAGVTVTVLEQEPDFHEVGAGLELAPNGTRILRDWGLLDQMSDLGVHPKTLVIKDAVTGDELTRMELDGEFEERYGAPYLVAHRGDLLTTLLDAARAAGVTLVTSERVDSVETTGDTAIVTAASGNSYQGRLVIAADGLSSTLRSELSADEPIASGYVAYRGMVKTDEVEIDADIERVVLYIGPGCHFVQYPIRKATDGEAALLNQVAVFQSPAFLRGEEEWGTPDEFDAAFAHCIPEIRHAIGFVPRERHWLMFDREPIEEWIAGRMVLTGDAAHPMLQYLAQGACQAIEDARVLQSTVVRHRRAGELDWPAIARDFTSRRSPRTARVQRNARLWGESWHVDGVARMLRNLLFTDRMKNDYKYTDWLYGKDVVNIT